MPFEYQSKADSCTLETYELPNVPLPIAAEMAEDTLVCPGCRAEISFEVTVVVSPWKSGQRKGKG